MHPSQQRKSLYVVLLILLSVVGSTALADSSINKIFSEVTLAVERVVEKAISKETLDSKSKSIPFSTIDSEASTMTAMAPMFTTIIQGADEEVGCSSNGFTVARFNLCGSSDDRIISLSGGPYSSVSWQILGGSCSPDINEDCPNTGSCYSQVATGQTFNLDASTVPATVGAEYRVVADGQIFYFKVKKSTISQTYVKEDYICDVPGRIQITNLSSAYEFSINSGSGFGPWQGAIFSNLLPGTYIVKARLRNIPNTCEYPYEPIEIVERNLDLSVNFTDISCFGETGTITVTPTPGLGPYKYTLLNSSGVAQEFTAFIPDETYTFSAVGSGTYIAQVETQQCTGDPLNGIDPPRIDVDTFGNPITIGSGINALDASTEVNSSFGCSTISNVDITVNTEGGSAPYSFTVNGGAVQPSYGNPSTDTGTTTFTVTAAGTYDFIITDSNGCTITASSNVENLLPPDITATGIDGTCSNGGAKIDFTINDARGYNLSYRVDSGDPWVTNPQISVAAGTYNNIEVRYQQSGFECTITLPPVTVTNVGVINGAANKISDVTCDGVGGINGGQIDFVGPFSGGSGSGYEFSIDGVNFTTITSYSNLSAGTYTPIIRDGGGCRLELTPIDILDVDPPTNLDFAQSNISCAAGTSDVTLTPTSNAAIVNYSIISPVSIDNGGSDTFIGLSTSTTYIFQITDANNCTYTEGFSPAVISSIRARVKSGGDLRVCNGASDGTGTFIIDGFANNYTYEINGGLFSGGPQNDSEVDLPLSGVGTYTITVTDADTGCTDTASFDIEDAPVLDISTSSVTAMSCANGNVGRVRANFTGGWGGNQYTLVPPSGPTIGPKSGRTFNNLTVAGTYTLTAEDAEGCIDTFTFDLTPIDAPALSLDNAASDFCYIPGTGATAVVTSTAGSAAIGTHEYRINGGTLQPTGTFSNLTPGNYTIEVVDGNNCSDTITINIAPQLRVNTTVVTEIPCGGAPGQIRVQVSGGYASGTGLYEVSSDNGVTFSAPVPYSSSTFLYDTNVDGTYVFRITDNNTTNTGCEATSAPLILNPPVNIAAASVTTRPVSCGAPNNGVATIIPDATSGVPPYEVNFNGMGWSSQTVYSDLPAGTYPYLVRDARGCETAPANAVIGTDATLPPDATVTEDPAICDGSGTLSGGINITGVTDGTANFDFRIEDNTGTEITRLENQSIFPITISDVNLVPGDYTVITLDANGCTDIDTVTITSNEVVITPIMPPLPPTCDDSAFTYAVSVSGGSGSYEIKLAQQPSFYPLNNTPGIDDHTFSNTADGIQYGIAYTVEVRDTVTGCIYEQEIPPVDAPSTLAITASSTPGACDVNRNGEISYQVTGYTIGDQLRIELLNNDDNTTTVIVPSFTTTALPYNNTYPELPGDYQIIVVNETDTCRDAAAVIIDQNLPAIDIISEVPANCNAFGQITVQGRGGSGGPYEFAFVTDGSPEPVYPADYDTATTFVAPAGDYDVYVRDASGCISFDIATVIQLDPDLPVPTFTVVNQCNPSSTSFDITVSMSNAVNTPRFTLGGDEQIPTDDGTNWVYTYTVASPGDYIVDVVDANGCTSQGTATVYNFLSATGTFSTDSTCNDADGEITIDTFGGSGDFGFILSGTDYTGAAVGPITQEDNPVFTGLVPGLYDVLVVDRIMFDGTDFCEYIVSDINLNQAAQPVITSEIATDITCRDSDDGTIEVVVGPANPLVPFTSEDTPITYILNNLTTSLEQDRNNTGAFSDLPEGDYQVQVLTQRGCEVLSGVHTITNPDNFSITAVAPDFACEPGANRYSSTIITVNVVDPGTIGSGYRYSITGFSNYQSSNTFEIVDNGSSQDITVYAIDGNGCQTTFDVPTINPPTDVVTSLSVVSPLDCANDERVRIDVVGTTDFTIVTTSVVPVANVNVSGSSFGFVDLPAAGDYLFEITDNTGGCTYPLPVHTVAEPELPTAFITEAKPVSCFGLDDGELFIEVSDYVGQYTYNVYMADDVTKSTLIATGNFDTTNYPDINGEEARITGLPGGNLIVEVVSTDVPFCTNDSNVANIRTPNGPLQVTAVSIGNVGCNNDSGEIEATGSGGWDNAPYEYRLWFSTDNGSTYTTEIAPFSINNEFTGLAFGFYRVEVQDTEGCPSTFDIELEEVPQIDAGIRQPQGLDCPNGNNAVLEAFDPSTGDATSAIAGATGGFPGAGYNYRLLYLNSNDNTDIASTSGLQNTPTFIGASGGFISAGWYAIEVSSSFDCLYVTEPYFVDPPPPVAPLLVQTRVPGCGGDGEMRLSIQNPDPSFTYEFAPVENGVVIGPYQPMSGTSVLVSGVQGITYQFDVRKTSLASTCLAVRSNGITMTDATGITLLPNLPDDISCASELDGRIESFVNGGVGDDTFFLYNGDPVDAFNPAATATLFRGPQDNGTFEGLPEGTDYYIAVTSGATCMDIAGPFEITRPEPIVFEANPTPVSCNGEEDGTITVEVLSGGIGLIQFAIGPTFNEFFSDPTTPGQYIFEDLAAGTYEILIQDENGCFERDFITVDEPEVLQVINIQTTPELCIGANDGTMTFDITGGTTFNDAMVSATPYYEYKVEMIDPVDETGNGTFEPFIAGQVIENLQGGASYAIYVRDANLCSNTELFTIGIGVDLTAEPIVEYGCEGIFPNSTVTIDMNGNVAMGDLMFALDPLDPTDAITSNAGVENQWGDLTAGTHIVYIYHQNGCTNFVEFDVDSYNPLTLSAEKTGPNEMVAMAEGGYGGYEYFFNGVSFGEETTYTTNESGMVNIRVVDANGCIAEVELPFEFTGMLEIPNFFTPDGDNMNDVWEPRNREFFDDVEVKIYDRYGRVVAVLDKVSGWDGTYEGKEVPSGDYWYVVNALAKRETRYVGHFTLYR